MGVLSPGDVQERGADADHGAFPVADEIFVDLGGNAPRHTDVKHATEGSQWLFPLKLAHNRLVTRCALLRSHQVPDGVPEQIRAAGPEQRAFRTVDPANDALPVDLVARHGRFLKQAAEPFLALDQRSQSELQLHSSGFRIAEQPGYRLNNAGQHKHVADLFEQVRRRWHDAAGGLRGDAMEAMIEGRNNQEEYEPVLEGVRLPVALFDIAGERGYEQDRGKEITRAQCRGNPGLRERVREPGIKHEHGGHGRGCRSVGPAAGQCPAGAPQQLPSPRGVACQHQQGKVNPSTHAGREYQFRSGQWKGAHRGQLIQRVHGIDATRARKAAAQQKKLIRFPAVIAQ